MIPVVLNSLTTNNRKDGNYSLEKAVVKCLTVAQKETSLHQRKQKATGLFESPLDDEKEGAPKIKYFDADRMAEVTIERLSNCLYIKV